MIFAYHDGAMTVLTRIFIGLLRPGSHELRHSNYCGNFKSYHEIFSTMTLDHWKNYHDSFGVTHAQYELQEDFVFCFDGADSIVKKHRHWIIGTFIMIVLQSHVFFAKFTTTVF